MSIHECAEIVRRGDPEKFLAILMAPLTLRGVLFPIYAFNYEISKIVYAISEPELAEIRLKWWEQELLFSSQNQSNSKHDILQPLSKLILSGDIPLKLFSNIIEARRFDIDKKPHASFEKQTMYIANIFSSLFEISLRASSDKTPDSAVQCVRNYGYALGVANLLKAVPALEMLGKNPIFLNLKINTKKNNLLGFNPNLLSIICSLILYSSSEPLSLKREFCIATVILAELITLLFEIKIKFDFFGVSIIKSSPSQ